MKFNLENFPVKGTPQAYERWGKGFKKELRELKEKTTEDYNIKNAKGWGKDNEQLNFLSGKYRTYLEILGETDG